MANTGEEGHPDSWTVYLTTDDVERTARSAIAKGGQVHMEPMQVAENGWFTIIGDPGGAGIGAWQAGEVTGFEIWNEPGAPRWFELETPQLRRRRRLLPRRLQVEHPHVQRHARSSATRLFAPASDDLAGIQSMPEGTPSGWTIYFGVDDTDAALERVVELGGSVTQPAQDTPYGRLAQAADPTGTAFKLMASA